MKKLRKLKRPKANRDIALVETKAGKYLWKLVTNDFLQQYYFLIFYTRESGDGINLQPTGYRAREGWGVREAGERR